MSFLKIKNGIQLKKTQKGNKLRVSRSKSTEEIHQ